MGLFGPSKKEKELIAEVDRLKSMLNPEQMTVVALQSQIQDLESQNRNT